MKLDSISYLLFLLIFSFWTSFAKAGRTIKFLICAADVLFILCFGWRAFIFTLAVVVINFALGRVVKAGRAIFLGSLLLNLGLIVAARLQFDDLILIVGASFVALQAISYQFEIRENILPRNISLLDLANYLLFFPKILAGPVEKPSEFFDKINRLAKEGLKPDYSAAWVLIFTGFVKKNVLADRIFSLLDPFFQDPRLYVHSGIYPLICVLLAYVQIFISLSAYTDIARGAAQLIGIDLALNFNRPFLAKNFSEFWARNHMSLSNWFKEFVFFPSAALFAFSGGAALALLLTTVLCGLWHGVALNFLIWGLLNAVFIFFGHWLARYHRFKFGKGSVLVTYLSASGLAVLVFCSSWNSAVEVFFSLVDSIKSPAVSLQGITGLEFSDFAVITCGLLILSVLGLRETNIYFKNEKIRWATSALLFILWASFKFKSQGVFTYLKF